MVVLFRAVQFLSMECPATKQAVTSNQRLKTEDEDENDDDDDDVN